jgi:hypothetical protein
MVTNMMNTGLERCQHFAIVNSEVFLLGTLDDIIVLSNLMMLDLYDHIDIHALHNSPKLLMISIIWGNYSRNGNEDG